MASVAVHYLLIPGWQGSPARHWQSHWHGLLPNACRVEQSDWQQPQRDAWVAGLQQAIEALPGPVILIAHSLGCITLAHWVQQADAASLNKVQGALLVAPADVERQGCPQPLVNFAPLPLARLPFPSLLVGSSNDHAASAERAQLLARHWGSEAVILPQAGHINIDSGHTEWEQGFAWLYRLQELCLQRYSACA